MDSNCTSIYMALIIGDNPPSLMTQVQKKKILSKVEIFEGENYHKMGSNIDS